MYKYFVFYQFSYKCLDSSCKTYKANALGQTVVDLPNKVKNSIDISRMMAKILKMLNGEYVEPKIVICNFILLGKD